MNITYNPQTCCWEFQSFSWSAFTYNLKEVMDDILRKESKTQKEEQEEEDDESWDTDDPRGWSDEEAIKRGYVHYGDLEGACHERIMEEEGIPVPDLRRKLKENTKPAPSISAEDALNKEPDDLNNNNNQYSSQRRVKKRSNTP